MSLNTNHETVGNMILVGILAIHLAIKINTIPAKIKLKIHALFTYISCFEGTSYKNL